MADVTDEQVLGEDAFSTGERFTKWMVKVMVSAVEIEIVPPASRSRCSPLASSGSIAAVTAAISSGVKAPSTLMKPSASNAWR